MADASTNRSGLLIGVAALAIAAGLWWFFSPGRTGGVGDALAQVSMPATLSAMASEGRELFAENCSTCHGENAEGRNAFGPPLIHIIYEPSHHSDASFHLAVASGVRAHHWQFGNMPPVPGVAPPEVDRIIAFIREVQRHNGIH